MTQDEVNKIVKTNQEAFGVHPDEVTLEGGIKITMVKSDPAETLRKFVGFLLILPFLCLIGFFIYSAWQAALIVFGVIVFIFMTGNGICMLLE